MTTSETRQRLALLLIGIAAMVIGLSVVVHLRQDACLDAGGRWLATRRCELNGAEVPASTRAYVAGVLAGIAAAVVLWRTFTFYATRASRRSR